MFNLKWKAERAMMIDESKWEGSLALLTVNIMSAYFNLFDRNTFMLALTFQVSNLLRKLWFRTHVIRIILGINKQSMKIVINEVKQIGICLVNCLKTTTDIPCKNCENNADCYMTAKSDIITSFCLRSAYTSNLHILFPFGTKCALTFNSKIVSNLKRNKWCAWNPLRLKLYFGYKLHRKIIIEIQSIKYILKFSKTQIRPILNM